MSTRSLIGRLDCIGTVTFVYCHSDGYLSHNGRILHESYKNPNKVDELLALGDLSVLGPNIGEKHDFDWMSKFWDKHGFDPDKWSGSAHEEWDRYRNMVRAYHRDRGEQLVVHVGSDQAEFWESDMGTEYWYLYKDRQWWVKAYSAKPVLLIEALAAEKEAEEAEKRSAAALRLAGTRA